MTILILHGIQSNAGTHWMGWLADECKKLGYEVIMPELPNADHPDRGGWLQKIFLETEGVDLSELVIVGHSLGVTSALDFVEALTLSIKGLISVSGFSRDYKHELNSYFLADKEIDFKKVKKNLQQAFVLYGDDDPYVPQADLLDLADDLEVTPEIIKKGGHLNTDAGYTEFERLLEIVKLIS